nr:response regulator [Treponema sp.]
IRQMSGYIVICVKDDGRGIDYEKVREKARKLYPNRIKEIDAMDNNSLQAFIFLSGFSTKENVSNLSGRGVGLDIVREKMEKIKGRFQLLSEEGKGTSFELVVPVSLATQQGIIIESAKKRFMFSSQYINEIISVSSGSFQDVGKQIVYNHNGNLISVYYLSALLGENIKSGGNFLILIEYMNKFTGIIVDNVSQYFSVVVKPLPALFDKLNILQGFIFDENYTMVPVLNVLEVIGRLRKVSDYDIKKREVIEDSYEKKYTILIVDDSTTTRAIERFILRGAGYDVVEAVEGVDALEKLKKIKVDLIVADLKMPNMDGKVLFNNLKRIGKYENIPVVIVSSVEDKKVQSEILAAGARAYIEKSSFERGTLLQVVKEILEGK